MHRTAYGSRQPTASSHTAWRRSSHMDTSGGKNCGAAEVTADQSTHNVRAVFLRKQACMCITYRVSSREERLHVLAVIEGVIAQHRTGHHKVGAKSGCCSLRRKGHSAEIIFREVTSGPRISIVGLHGVCSMSTGRMQRFLSAEIKPRDFSPCPNSIARHSERV